MHGFGHHQLFMIPVLDSSARFHIIFNTILTSTSSPPFPFPSSDGCKFERNRFDVPKDGGVDEPARCSRAATVQEDKFLWRERGMIWWVISSLEISKISSQPTKYDQGFYEFSFWNCSVCCVGMQIRPLCKLTVCCLWGLKHELLLPCH